ncbi:SGNH/GDSL hydrolase family protein [Celeribacter arenosi]|uniref:SGNH hydrolase-type esterase domain-containing protein n=1 Tax=Celeribacter arenosi TaxID=792649 RepID=A0ABP7JWJ0_9RHOB
MPLPAHLIPTWILRRFLILLLVLPAMAAASDDTSRAPKILAIGDSMMSWHSVGAASVPHALARLLDEPVQNAAIAGARIVSPIPPLRISAQYGAAPERDWDWVVVNGGGNDLVFGCGCRACDNRIARMIGPKGQRGDIPKLVRNIRKTGARVVYVGYLRSPGVNSAIDICAPQGDELERRLSAMAAQDKGVYFLPIHDLVPHKDTSFHSLDMVHPSRKGSHAIATRIAALIRAKDRAR